jgi:PEP-CTERM motif
MVATTVEEDCNMRKHLSLAAVAAAALLMASTAQASLIWFPPDSTAAAPATLGQYTMTAFGDDARPNGTVSDVASPLGGVVGFSPDLTHVEIGAGWATWSHGYTGDVYFTNGTTITLTLPSGTGAFYFFAEPNVFDLFTITAVADDGSGSAQVVNGFSGAKFFGVYSDDFAAIDHIDITVDPSAMGFAVGEFGIAAVPEPSTLLLMGAGLLATRMRRRKA